jgi:primosomal protein N'
VTTHPGVGDRVRVPWGLDEVDGTVVEVYDSGLGPRVVVRVLLEGVDPESAETVTLPLSAIKAA